MFWFVSCFFDVFFFNLIGVCFYVYSFFKVLCLFCGFIGLAVFFFFFKGGSELGKGFRVCWGCAAKDDGFVFFTGDFSQKDLLAKSLKVFSSQSELVLFFLRYLLVGGDIFWG